MSLFLKSDVGSLAHAITLWGVEYAEDGRVSKLWITDSRHGVASSPVGQTRSREPTTATVSLLALAALASRRHR